MKITEIRIHKFPTGNVKAVAAITLDDMFAIHDIRLVEGKNGMFLSFPAKKRNDKYTDVAHPTKTSVRDDIANIIIGAYEKMEDEEIVVDKVDGKDIEVSPRPS